MTPQQFIDLWLATAEPDRRQQRPGWEAWLRTTAPDDNDVAAPSSHASLGDSVIQLLNRQYDAMLRTDLEKCQAMIDAMQLVGEVTGLPTHQALAHLAQGNLLFAGRGAYREAITHFDAALAIYAAEKLPVRQASVMISKVVALGHLGRYAEAETAAGWARAVLAEHGEQERLASLIINMALILHMRRGDDSGALALLDEAGDRLRQAGQPHHPYIAFIEQNRAAPLRHLGRFAEAMAASQRAYTLLTAQGYTAEAMRARQNLALTAFMVGRYQEALHIFEEVRIFWEQDGRFRDAVMVELFVSDGLLALYRYADVVEKCQAVRTRFAAQGVTTEVAQAAVLQARALAGLGQSAAALETLAEAEALYRQEDNWLAVYLTQLERATIQATTRPDETALRQVSAVAAWFRASGHLVPETRALLLLARMAARLGQPETYDTALARARQLAQAGPAPALLVQVYETEGDWRLTQQDEDGALAAYDAALEQVESIKGRVMVEYRVTVADNTYTLYEKATALAIRLQQYSRALHYAERAKSRALLDLIAQRLELTIQARQAEDQPLVDELLRLRAERDRLYRRLEGSEELRRADSNPYDADVQHQRRQIVAYERQMTALWHQLLIRNGDYAREASLWQPPAVSVQTLLPADTLLVEFYRIQGRYVAFLATAEGLDVVSLTVEPAQVTRWLHYLRINGDRVTPNKEHPGLLQALTQQAQAILQALYQALWLPLESHLAGHTRLIVAPHGALHHLPFQALYDGERYLLERFEMSYAPNGALLAHMRSEATSPGDFFALGFSAGQQLPFAVSEAQAVGELMGGKVYLDEAATLERLREIAPQAHILHLATHGEFNADNALFSGLSLADGQLVTLDVFQLPLRASLVTLSACQTGRHQASQGEEVLGLMRGFLAAGAATLVLTHWSVTDRATAGLMEQFYHALRAGRPKAAALRQAQQWLAAQPPFSHPYYWAPFYLVGDAGPL